MAQYPTRRFHIISTHCGLSPQKQFQLRYRKGVTTGRTDKRIDGRMNGQTVGCDRDEPREATLKKLWKIVFDRSNCYSNGKMITKRMTKRKPIFFTRQFTRSHPSLVLSFAWYARAITCSLEHTLVHPNNGQNTYYESFLSLKERFK